MGEEPPSCERFLIGCLLFRMKTCRAVAVDGVRRIW
jgi:hypothetical protein